ncbi:hypothetical protein D3C75_1074260 [compost metagenome]
MNGPSWTYGCGVPALAGIKIDLIYENNHVYKINFSMFLLYAIQHPEAIINFGIIF